jgi:hypothetical protein
MDKDYFSDILFFELYPNTAEEAANIPDEDEEAICDVYNSKWDMVDKAFKEVFGFSREEVYKDEDANDVE